MCCILPSLDDRVVHAAHDHVKIHYVITSVPLGNPFTLKKCEVVLFISCQAYTIYCIEF